MSAGLFLPSLLIGAAWGRIASIIMHHYIPNMVRYIEYYDVKEIVYCTSRTGMNSRRAQG